MNYRHEMECDISATPSPMSYFFCIVPFLLKSGQYWFWIATLCGSSLSYVVFGSGQSHLPSSTLWILGLEFRLSSLAQGTLPTDLSQTAPDNHMQILYIQLAFFEHSFLEDYTKICHVWCFALFGSTTKIGQGKNLNSSTT